MELDIDVLVIGGGVQGLWLMNDLTISGYSSFLVTKDDLGVGQTLHSHVYLHRGHLYDNIQLIERLMLAVKEWDRFIAEHKPTIPKTRPLFIFDKMTVSQFLDRWNKVGLNYNETDLPAIFSKGKYSQFARPLETRETWLSGEQLIGLLRAPIAQKTRRGQVLEIRAHSDRIQHVIVSIDNEMVTFRPKFLVIAAGAGNQQLLNMVSTSDTSYEPLLGGKFPDIQRLRCSQMLTIKGRELTEIACISPMDLFFVSRTANDECVWLVSSGHDIDPPEGDLLPSPTVDKTRMQTTIDLLEDVAPDLFRMNLDWGVYTGYKSERRQPITRKGLPSSECVEDFQSPAMNLRVIWPTKLTLAPLASRTAMEAIKKVIGEPEGNQVSEAVPGNPAAVGSENWRQIEPWLKWHDFQELHQLQG